MYFQLNRFNDKSVSIRRIMSAQLVECECGHKDVVKFAHFAPRFNCKSNDRKMVI